MIEIRETQTFRDWLGALRDRAGAAVIARRVQRLTQGNFGDAKSVGEGVSELRINFGPGYRVYFTRRGAVVVVLLIGGDKSTQGRDIEKAHEMAKEI